MRKRSSSSGNLHCLHQRHLLLPAAFSTHFRAKDKDSDRLTVHGERSHFRCNSPISICLDQAPEEWHAQNWCKVAHARTCIFQGHSLYKHKRRPFTINSLRSWILEEEEESEEGSMEEPEQWAQVFIGLAFSMNLLRPSRDSLVQQMLVLVA